MNPLAQEHSAQWLSRIELSDPFKLVRDQRDQTDKSPPHLLSYSVGPRDYMDIYSHTTMCTESTFEVTLKSLFLST
jgi:hypothetical protein